MLDAYSRNSYCCSVTEVQPPTKQRNKLASVFQSCRTVHFQPMLHKFPLIKWSLHTGLSDRKQHVFCCFLFVNNNLGHLIKTLVGFSAGSIGAIVNNANCWHNGSWVYCFCSRKSLHALRLHFVPRNHWEVTLSANKLLELYNNLITSKLTLRIIS